MAFDLGKLLQDVSDSDTGREQIEYIKLDLIDGDDYNFYELSDLDNLANNIATIGLQQPLRVRVHPEKDGRYMVVSGHRRRAALTMLAEEDPQRWSEVACIVDRDTVSPALQQLRLIFGNSGTRKMSSADQNEQAAQVEKLLYQLKEDGYEFPGRMRDHVAEVVQLSKTKLAKLKMIRDNLASCWQQAYKDDILGESSAYELSRMPTEQQILLFEEKQRTKANIKYLYADDIKKFAERAAAIDQLTCERSCGGACINRDSKLRKTAVTERSCVFYCDKCCESCYNLTSCKNACPRLKDKVKQINADAKEAQRQAAKAAEERDRPDVEKVRDLWHRFGLARNRAGKSVKESYCAAGIYYAASDDADVAKKETSAYPFAKETPLPYGYSFRLSYANALIAVADLFGCSIDYLFGRTDIREMAQDVPRENVPESDTGHENTEIIPGAWYPASVEPPIDADIIMVDRWECVSDDKYLGCGTLKDATCMEWTDAVLWTLLPKKATADSLPEPPNEEVSQLDTALHWQIGRPAIPGDYILLIRYGKHAPMRTENWEWDGERWVDDTSVFDPDVDGNIMGWIPMPDGVKESKSYLNSQCVTGLNPYGHCGSAACCSEPYNCCKDCPDPCNSRCGYLEDDE